MGDPFSQRHRETLPSIQDLNFSADNLSRPPHSRSYSSNDVDSNPFSGISMEHPATPVLQPVYVNRTQARGPHVLHHEHTGGDTAHSPRDVVPQQLSPHLPSSHPNYGQQRSFAPREQLHLQAYQYGPLAQLLPQGIRNMPANMPADRSNTSTEVSYGRPQVQLPPLYTRSFNPERYPAFDQQGNRTGVVHPRQDPSPSLQQATHYGRLPSADQNQMDVEGARSPMGRSPYESSSPQDVSSEDDFRPRLTPDPSQAATAADSSSSSSSPLGLGFGSHEHFPPPTTVTPSMRLPDPGDILRSQLNLPPGVPVNLHSLQDPPNPGERPIQSLPTLMKVAIYGSPQKRLTLQEIYTALESRFEYFRNRTEDKSWKSSIRHALSLHKVFRHAPRPITLPGKGKYWELDYSQGEGNKRPRKRRNQRASQATQRRTDVGLEGEESDGESMSSNNGSSFDESLIDPSLRHAMRERRLRPTARRAVTTTHYHPSTSGQQGLRPYDTSAGLFDGHADYRLMHPSFDSRSVSPHGESTFSRAYASEYDVRQPVYPGFPRVTFGQPSLLPADVGPAAANVPRSFPPSLSESLSAASGSSSSSASDRTRMPPPPNYVRAGAHAPPAARTGHELVGSSGAPGAPASIDPTCIMVARSAQSSRGFRGFKHSGNWARVPEQSGDPKGGSGRSY